MAEKIRHTFTDEDRAKANEAISKKALEKKERFCLEYVSNGYNATQAYLEAYNNSSTGSAGCNASRLMKDPFVIKRIDELIHEKYLSLHINADRIAEKLAEMAFAAKDDEVYGPSVALKALDMLQKQLGLQKQKIDADLNTPTTIKVSIKSRSENNEGQTGDGVGH